MDSINSNSGIGKSINFSDILIPESFKQKKKYYTYAKYSKRRQYKIVKWGKYVIHPKSPNLHIYKHDNEEL